MVFNLMIGMITPPVGMSVYMLSPIVDMPVESIQSRHALFDSPIDRLVILTYVPQIIR